MKKSTALISRPFSYENVYVVMKGEKWFDKHTHYVKSINLDKDELYVAPSGISTKMSLNIYNALKKEILEVSMVISGNFKIFAPGSEYNDIIIPSWACRKIYYLQKLINDYPEVNI